MDFNSATSQLECYFCKIVHPVPIHHGKEMKIIINNQRDRKDLFIFISPLQDEE